MKERPIIFNATMVRVILAGKKTQTRRIVKPQPSLNVAGRWVYKLPKKWSNGGRCPFVCSASREWWEYLPDGAWPYQIGDHLWVRETFTQPHICDLDYKHPARALSVVYAADDRKMHHLGLSGFCQHNGDFAGSWKPSIHMPRWASRIKLEVTGIGVERLQDISPADVYAEGIGEFEISAPDVATEMFCQLWNKINGEDAWQDNPWVWVVEFTPTDY